MNPHQLFLDEILANPDDDNPRLVYADWLIERDDPRGEFIQLQCARAQLPEFSREAYEMRRRELALLGQYRKQWAGELHELLYPYEFHRGFIDWGRANTSHFVETASTICAQTPLQHLVLARGSLRSLNLAKLPQLKSLKSICFAKCKASEAVFGDFFDSPVVGKWESVGFSDVPYVPLRRLAAAAPSLRDLYLRSATVRSSVLSVDSFPELRTLRIKGTNLDETMPHTFRELAEISFTKNLHTFGYCDWREQLNELYLLHDPAWSNLKKLEISLPTDAAIESLLDCPRRLDALTIESYPTGNQMLSPKRLQRLLECPMLSQLKALKLIGAVEDSHAEVLARWPGMQKLLAFNLAGTGLSPDRLRELVLSIPDPVKKCHGTSGFRGNDNDFLELANELGPGGREILRPRWHLTDANGMDWAGAFLTLK